jgi:O-antigen ligase
VEFFYLIGMLVVLAWGVALLLRGGPIVGAMLVLLAGTCFGHPFFNLPVGRVPLTADRLLLVVLAGQYLLYRHWGWIESRPIGAADYALFAFITVLFVSTLAHDFHYHNELPLAQLMFYFLMPAVLYWVVRGSTFDSRSVSWLLGSLALFGVYLAVTAVAETRAEFWLVFPKYIASTEYRDFLGRGRGPLLNPVGNGILLALSTCAALIWWPTTTRLNRGLLLAALAALAWGMYSTLTRSVWMGAAGGVLVICVTVLPVRWRILVVGSAVVATGLVLFVGWDNLVAFKRDQYATAEETADSVRLRPILATVAWHMFLDRPLLGCGYGQYAPEVLDYLSDRTTEMPLEKARPYVQHNTFLALLVEVGVIGLGCFLAMLAVWTRWAWWLWRHPSAPTWARQAGLLFLGFMGIYLPNAMFHDVSIIPMINMVLFFLGGAVTGIASGMASATRPERIRLWLPEDELVGAAG